MSAAARPEVNADNETTIGIFYDKSSIADLINAARVVQKLGQVPEIRIVEDSADEPHGVELFVKDVPAMARTLALSIAQNGRRQ